MLSSLVNAFTSLVVSKADVVAQGNGLLYTRVQNQWAAR